MTIPDPTYATEAELKEATLIEGLKALQPADHKVLLQLAEDHIDRYVGRQAHHLYDDNTLRVFPRVQDYEVVTGNGARLEYPDTPEIPYEVSMACLRQAEHLYSQWWPNKATAQVPTEHTVESESIGGDGSYSADYARDAMAQATLCAEARAWLDNRFVSRAAGIATSSPC